MYKLSLDFTVADLKTMVLKRHTHFAAARMHDDNNSSVNALLRYIYSFTRSTQLSYRNVNGKRCAVPTYMHHIIYILSSSDHIILLSSIINNMRQTVAAQLFSRLACNDSSFIFERGELDVL